MTQTRNPWVQVPMASPGAEQDPGQQPEPEQPRSRRRRRHQPAPQACLPPPLTGPATPQDGVPLPVERLPLRRVTQRASLWVVGAHGGAGETSIAGLDPAWAATGHSWPTADIWCPTIVVGRTNVGGLTAVQAALTQWAGRDTGTAVDLLGLILIADAPGRLPKALDDLATVVAGGGPRTWRLPWFEAWRHGEPAGHQRPVQRLVRDLHRLTDQPPTAQAVANSRAAAAAADTTEGQEQAS